MSVPLYLALISAILATSIIFIARREREGFNVLSIGPIYLGIISLYAIVPFAVFQITGFVFTGYSDNRLVVLQPDKSEILNFSFLYIGYVIGFSTAYILVKRSSTNFNPFPRLNIDLIPTIVVYLILTLVVTTIAFLYLPKRTTYFEEYAFLNYIPLFLRQAYLQATGALTVVKFILLYRLLIVEKNRLLAISFLTLELALTFNPAGSRREFFLLLVCFLVLYSTFVKKISLTMAAILGACGIIAFLVLGDIRSGNFDRGATTVELLSANSEFTAMFVTALDVKHRVAAGEAAPITFWLYFGDFVGLIPQQLLPFGKISPPDWYTQTFYPDATGQGFGFGAIAESALGFGVAEATTRGFLVGMIFAFFQRTFINNRKNILISLFYVWFITVMYDCFRVTTFYPLHMFVFQFLPAIIMTAGLSQLTRAATSRALLPRDGSYD